MVHGEEKTERGRGRGEDSEGTADGHCDDDGEELVEDGHGKGDASLDGRHEKRRRRGDLPSLKMREQTHL